MQKYLILFLIFLLGCSSQPADSQTPTSPTSTADEAQAALIQFFELLSTKQYAEADLLYGGEYDQLQVFTPSTDTADHAALWSWSCENAGLQCLKVRTATFESVRDNTYVFQVEFSNADGSLFILGPCCGADETEMPPISKFEYTVLKTAAEKFVVLNLPPYSP